MGSKLTNNDIKSDENKVRTVENIQALKTSRNIQRLLGIVTQPHKWENY